jgi:hypothetical protein
MNGKLEFFFGNRACFSCSSLLAVVVLPEPGIPQIR